MIPLHHNRKINANTYRIHGYYNENNFRKYVSQGCVKMHHTDVENLFDKVECR
ncbi:L,D-transpeptidase [Priestia megaterium]|uniref:L,D-transpeptidase n=1 Tax=Priestia megaterium TaxID=1404 RepID=UPI002E2193A8|nr:L,D-transpeptidase [Priestia megaterium]